VNTRKTDLPRLLGADEPPAVQIFHPQGRSAYVLVCDHAGNRLPRVLGDLGLSAADLERHIAWDIGAADLSEKIADALDAVVIEQTYSRLAIDCNRPPLSATSTPPISETTEIPGNRIVSARDAAMRRRDIFQPYHDRIAATLDARKSVRRPTILVAMHSFTRDFAGEESRPWHVGVLYNRDARLGRILLDLLRTESGLVVGDNQPYSVDDDTDYTIPVHGEQRGLAHVALEIRQDLLADESGREQWAQCLVRVLGRAEALLNGLA